ncbi:MAG: hypothetical protein QG637_1304 [Chloroflexota bacterium]|nr:hypothetical protein [Chloroflexota bacterium]
MMQSRLHRHTGAQARLSRALFVILLAAFLAGQANFPSAAAPQPAAASPRSGLKGPQPLATILCKFADVPAEPDPVAYFERLLGSAYPGLAHYWREVSYGAISLAGSTVTGWHALPHPQASYLTGTPNAVMPTAQSPVDLQRLTEDCVAAAGDTIELSRYVGLNLVFNANLDRPRGTEVCLELRGGSRCYRTAWFWPDWYHNQSIWAHEMGHAFGLQHSSVGEGNGYGNMWDVMSVDGPCRTETPFGRIGQHPIAYQKDVLGWLPTDRIFVAEGDSQATITLAQMAQTALPAPGNYLLARIPIPAHSLWPVSDRTSAAREGAHRHYYTVEARRRIGYDASLPADGIIIHEVSLDEALPVRPVSAGLSDGGSRGATTGSVARWLPGQVFQDAEHGVAISVDRATPTGFVVTIFTRPPPAPLSAQAWQRTPAGATAEAVSALGSAGALINAQAVAGPDGSIYAIWTEHADSSATMMQSAAASPDLYFAQRLPDGAWGERERVNDDSRDARSHPALVADRGGNIYAAWVDYRDGAAAIYAAARPAGGAWSKNVRLARGAADGYGGLTLFVDAAGAVHVLWEGLDRCGGSEAILGGEE